MKEIQDSIRFISLLSNNIERWGRWLACLKRQYHHERCGKNRTKLISLYKAEKLKYAELIKEAKSERLQALEALKTLLENTELDRL